MKVHRYLAHAATALLLAAVLPAQAEESLNLVSADEWLPADPARWQLDSNAIRGRTLVLDGAKTDPDASAFLETRRAFAGDKSVTVELEFEEGRYFGIYFDYDPGSESGIWMASGHFLPEEQKLHNVESAYIKTVDNGHWIVRATGELDVPDGAPLRLRFDRSGDDYRIWQGDRLVVTYRKPGGYPPGKLRLRLVNAIARITVLEATAERISAIHGDGP